MANITRFSPFHELERFSPFRELEDMWKSMRVRPMAGMESFGDIRMDVFEDDKAYTVKADIPGVSKEDIRVAIDGNQVTIGAEIRRETEGQGRSQLCSERFQGQMYRSFSLDSPIDEDKAEAHYEGGVLALTLPKKAGGSGAHRVEIH